MSTVKQKKAIEKMVENGGNKSQAMIAAGYSPATAKNPKKLTESKGFAALMEKNLPDDLLIKRHTGLLNSTRMDHMVFPLGPKDKKNKRKANLTPEIKTIVEAQQELERTTLTDNDIKKLLADSDCMVRKIVHGTNARHVYFWSPDNTARDKALEKAYKLKGKYPTEKVEVGATDDLKDWMANMNKILDGE